jgi:SAM-dependent methyltransferase
MLDRAEIGPGSRVLDVACGAGEQSIAAARRAGPSGSVLATDMAPAMIAAAGAAVAAAGLANVTTRVCPAEAVRHDGNPFDAAICRLGLMLMADPALALRGILATLRPGGRFAAVVPGPAERNPFNALPLEVLRRHAGKPAPPSGPGLFALADAARLARLLEEAGFVGVTVTAVPSVRRLASAEAAVTMIKDAFGFYRALIDDQPEPVQTAAWAEVAQVLRRFEGREGAEQIAGERDVLRRESDLRNKNALVAPGELLVAAGRAASS